MRNQILAQFLQVRRICTDTRKIEKEAIFFALKGGSFNGNQFALQALNAGCSMAVVDEKIDGNDPRIIYVSDALRSLQELAADFRATWNFPVLAITGSNGKTTTKELVRDVLAKKFKVHATVGNLNNHIGIPLTILSLPRDADFAVIEMGANHQGEIADYCTYTLPQYGMITNIGKAHLDGFGGVEGVKKGKGELFAYLRRHQGKAFVDCSLEYMNDVSMNMDIIPFGSNGESFQTRVSAEDPTLSFELTVQSHSQVVNTHLAGAYNLNNINAAIAAGIYFGVSLNDIVEAIEHYNPTNNRSQLLTTDRNTLIMDAYNANPSSMEHALINLAKQGAPRKFFIIGDMLELGNYAMDEHRRILEKATELDLKGITVGPVFHALSEDFVFPSFEKNTDAKSYVDELDLSEHLILLKGSRGIAVDVIKEVL